MSDAAVTVQVTSTPRQGTGLADLFPRGEAVARKVAAMAVEVFENGWGPFLSGKAGKSSVSGAAMKATVDPETLEIIVQNDATDRYGRNYAQYVHLAGTPPDQTLAKALGPEAGRQLGQLLMDGLAAEFFAPKATTTTMTT